MEDWLRNLFAWLPDGWRYSLLVGVVAYLESLPVMGLLIPGSTLVLFAGFLALHGKGAIATIMLVSTVGAILGDLSSYGMGARAGAPMLQSQLLRRRINLVRKAELFFAAHGGKSVVFARFVGPVRGIVPFIAGCTQMRPLLVAWYVLLSGILWGLAYPGLGYLAGASWQRVKLWSGRFSLLIAAALVATILGIWVRRMVARRRELRGTKALRGEENSPKMPPSEPPAEDDSR